MDGNHTPQQGNGQEAAGLGFETELETLAAAIASVGVADAPSQTPTHSFQTLVEHLRTAEEELRVADEEVRAQQDEVSRLIRSAQARRWQHERLLAVLPSPLVVTSREGAIQSINAAAASLWGMRIDHLLRRPIQSLLEPSDRTDVRRDLAAAIRDGEGSFRRLVTVTPRSGAPLSVEAVVTVHREPVTGELEVTWLLLAPDDSFAAELPETSRTSVARALVELTQLPLHLHDESAILRRATTICQGALGDAVEVTVTVGEPAAPTHIASTGPLAQRVDGAQIISGEGPCELAWRTSQTVVSHDLLHDPRWPRLVATLHNIPVIGALAIPVAVGDTLLGAINVYSTSDVDGDLPHIAEMLGTAVAAILSEFEVKAELELTAHNYREALTSRSVIDQAKGIIMANQGCSAEDAFDALVTMSSHQNRKLRDIATRIVASTATGKAPGPSEASRNRLPGS